MRTPRRPRDRRHLLVVVVVFTLVVGACGTRVPREEALEVLRGQAAAEGGRVPGSPDGSGTSSGFADHRPDGSSEAESTGRTSDGAGTESSPRDPARPNAHDGSPARKSEPGRQEPKSPIVVGMVGVWTGIAGAAFAPARDAFGAWVQMVNDRGGINGHPVKLLVADDGGDPARTKSIVQDFVENRGVVALVNYFGVWEDIDGYVESKRIPVVGGYGLGDAWDRSWAMFPASASNTNMNFAWAKVSADTGAKKVGTVYCSEGDICAQKEAEYAKFAEQLGLEVVYRARVSLAQPDFTAECLEARNRGAELIMPVVDGNSVNRLVQSCQRQGFEPTFINSNPSEARPPDTKRLLAPIPSFPWFLTGGSPGLEEYGDAMDRYVDQPLAVRSSQGWVAGKLLEKTAQNLSDPPTSADLLAGLWALENETLGGLTPPLTFPRERPHPEPSCVFLVEATDGGWTARVGTDLVGCRG